MDNVKGDSFYLEKIVADLKFVIDHTKGMTQTEMEENDLLIDSVMFRIVQVAENGAKLSEAFRMAHPDIPWAAIRGMRNRIVHNYGVVSMTVVYDTVINHIPKMYSMLVDRIIDDGHAHDADTVINHIPKMYSMLVAIMEEG